MNKNSKRYPSDISRKQFERIRSMLESARKITKPRKIDLYNVFNAVLYVLKTGCQWRSLPHDYPKWSTVYSYFKVWKDAKSDTEKSLIEEILKKISWRGETKQWSERENKFCHS